MKNLLLAGAIAAAMLSACVSPRVVQDLKTENAALDTRLDSCRSALSDIRTDYDRALVDMEAQSNTIRKLVEDTIHLSRAQRRLNDLYQRLNTTYEELIDRNKTISTESMQKAQELAGDLQKLQAELQEREQELTQKELALQAKEAKAQELGQNLTMTQSELMEKVERVNELERLIGQKDSANQALRKSIADALLSFQDQGLTVSLKDGKVYVSLQEKLLFASGRYEIDKNGKQALLKLAEVLNTKPSVAVLIEGHTDNVPISAGSCLKDNWDLSVLRATEVARVLTEQGNVDPQRVVASGRSKYVPVDSSDSVEARRRNRRTEIILTPNLDELYQLIETK
ncbi:MAG: OmpA family protein [Bacteroidia bacterium]